MVYCIDHDDRKQIQGVSYKLGLESDAKTPLAIIGNQSDYERYIVLTGKQADLFFQRTLSINSVFEALSAYISGIQNPLSPEEAPQPEEERVIMVIDDSPLMLKTISSMLNNTYKVATAKSGKAARRYLAGKTVDLILLDYEMPDENGLSIFMKLKGNPATADIPIVFLTGVDDIDKVCGALSLQPDGYLLKPVEVTALTEKIEEMLRQTAR